MGGASALIVNLIVPGVTQAPSISGVTEVGQTLTASTGAWLGTVPLTYSYQWLHCNGAGGACSEIPGATSATYFLAGASVGFRLRVQVTAANTVGIVSALSDASATVTALPVALTRPANTIAPAISGVVQVGQTLIASTGAWTGSEPMAFDYHWLRCSALGFDCVEIAGVTTATYAVTSASLGATLKVRVVADNAAGAVEATSEPTTAVAPTVPVLPSNTGPPTLSGLAEVGQTLVAGNGVWTGTVPIGYAYQWLRCDSSGGACAEIAGATGATLALTSVSLGATVRVRVTASDSAGSATAQSATSATVTAAPAVAVPQPPAIATLPSIAGVLEVGETLTAATGIWNGTPPFAYTYHGRRGDGTGGACVDIAGATGATYLLTSASLGSTLSVRVTATDSAGSASAVSPASGQVLAAPAAAVLPANTEAPSFGGVVAVGQTLTASAGLWTGTAPLRYAYQWQLCDTSGAACVDIAGETAATHELATVSVGSTVRVRVTVTDAAGSSSVRSAASGPVERAISSVHLPVSLNLPEISGEAQVGEPLAASSGAWASTALPTFTYQWLLCNGSGGGCIDIPAATTAHYAVPSAAIGATLRMRVRGSNSAGATVVISPATSAILAAPPATEFPVTVGAPAVSGQVQLGQTLTASSGAWTGTPPLRYAYQWLRCDASGANCGEIAGATAVTHTLAVDLLGDTVRVRVTANSDAGSAEVISAATPPITDPAHIEAVVAPPASSPADGAVVARVSLVTLTPARPVRTTLDLTLDGTSVTAVVTPTSVVVATGSLAPGLHHLEGALVNGDGTQSPVGVHFTVEPTAAGTAPAAAAAAITPTASTTVAISDTTSVSVPAGSIEDPGTVDRLVVTIRRSLHTSLPPGVALPTVLPSGLGFAGPVFTVSAGWELAGMPVVSFAKPLEVTIPAETMSGAVKPEDAVLATAPEGASAWRLLAACGAQGRLAPGQVDCYQHRGTGLRILTLHLSHFSLLRHTAPLTATFSTARRIPLYSQRFIPLRVSLSRAARATITLRTVRGHVVRRWQRRLAPGRSTVYFGGITARPFPRSGQYVLVVSLTAEATTVTDRRSITLIRRGR